MQQSLFPDFEYESRLSEKFRRIAGLDEAGRGPLAGPVVAAAVVLRNDDLKDFGINDSKKLTAKKREELFEIIKNSADDYGIGIVGP